MADWFEDSSLCMDCCHDYHVNLFTVSFGLLVELTMAKKPKLEVPWKIGRHAPIKLWENLYPGDEWSRLYRLERERKHKERLIEMSRQYETVNLDRKSIGPADPNDPSVIEEFEGEYQSSRVTAREDGSITYLHRVVDDETGEEFELWGCDALDRHIVYFPEGTGIHLKFRGMKDLKANAKRKTAQRYKDIRVQCEAGTQMLPEGQENIINQLPVSTGFDTPDTDASF
jgi:hypothetical protein